MNTLQSLKKSINQYPWYIRIIFWAQKQKYGSPLEPSLYWARDPLPMLGLQVLYRCIDRKKIPIEKSLRLLASLRISQLNNCSFCFDISASQMEKYKISQEKLLNLENHASSNLFDEKEKLILKYVDSMTITGLRVSPDLLNQLKSFLSDQALVYLTSWISFQNMTSKFNAAFDVPSQGFCVKK